MSEREDDGIVYTDHAALKEGTPFASLWSYRSDVRRDRRTIERNSEGDHEYWLHRSDPLLNTALPGTHVSIVVNVGDPWAIAGRRVPRVAVFGPVMTARPLHWGSTVGAIGAVFRPTLAAAMLGVTASVIADQVRSLGDFWNRSEVEQLVHSLTTADLQAHVLLLKQSLLVRIGQVGEPTIEDAAVQFLLDRGGLATVEEASRAFGVSRQLLARRFRESVGLSPKLFGRIIRFQKLLPMLLSTDVHEWAAIAPRAGFYDQAHMINEFRIMAGASPTMFFQPRGRARAKGRLRGRPSEWDLGVKPGARPVARSQNLVRSRRVDRVDEQEFCRTT